MSAQWDRLTFTRLTTIYFVFSVVHCFIQVVLQVQAFSINAQAANLLSDIVHQGNAKRGFDVDRALELRPTIDFLVPIGRALMEQLDDHPDE